MAVRRPLAALLALPILLLTGCGDDSSIADPPVRSSPPSSAPTTDPPAHETAEHFIRRFYEAEAKMENTGHVKAYSAMTRKCAPCSALVENVQSIYRAGGFIRWGGLTIASIDKFSGSSHSGLSFSIKFNARPTRYKESASSSTRSLPGG